MVCGAQALAVGKVGSFCGCVGGLLGSGRVQRCVGAGACGKPVPALLPCTGAGELGLASLNNAARARSWRTPGAWSCR